MADIIRPIEPFELTQLFGVNPQNYAKFGLKGHNGWDLRTKFSDSPDGKRPILSSWDQKFYRQGFDAPGYGLFFETVCQLKSLWKLTFAHCDSIKTFSDIGENQQMATSDNTGNSTGSHLHLTVKRIKIVNGVHEVIDYNNGYFGAVNPQEFFDELRAWKKSGKVSTIKQEVIMQIDEKTFTSLVDKSNNRDQIYDYLGVSRDPVESNIDKPKGVIDGYKNLATGLQRQLAEAQQEVLNQKDKVTRIQQTMEASAKTDAARIDALEKAQKAWDVERESLRGQLESFAKAKGEALNEAQAWKTKYEQVVTNQTQALTIGEVLRLLFEKIAPIKLR